MPKRLLLFALIALGALASGATALTGSGGNPSRSVEVAPGRLVFHSDVTTVCTGQPGALWVCAPPGDHDWIERRVRLEGGTGVIWR